MRPARRIPRFPRRRKGLIGLIAAVLVLHAVALALFDRAATPPTPAGPPAPLFTRVLLPGPAPRAVVAPRPAATAEAPALERRPRSAPPTPTATATNPTATTPREPTATPPASAPPPRAASAPGPAPKAPAPTARASGASASAAASAPAARASAPGAPTRGVPWPPSTRIDYAVTGHWRGSLHGSGTLEWQRDGDRYRVALTGTALISFGYTSDGRIAGDWLAPDRYAESVLSRSKVVTFDRAAGLLRFTAMPSTLPIPERLQDSVSVFIQLAHRLDTRPQDFVPGHSLHFEVARPTGTTNWDFVVVGHEPVATGVGTLACWKLDHPPDSHGLGAAVWLAPSLQDLPVRIRLDQGDGDFLDFTLRQAMQ